MDMNQNNIAVLLLLMSCIAVISASSCHRDGPEDCNFQNDQNWFCSWINVRNFGLWISPTKSYAAGLRRWKEEGQLISRTACPTGHTTRCLEFRYFYEKDNIIDLSVSVRYAGSTETEPPLWTTSGSSYPWEYAKVPIQTSRPFQVVFTAKKRPANSSSKFTVIVDNIQYRTRAICEIQPEAAKPPTPLPTTPTTTSTTTTAAAVTDSTVAITSPDEGRNITTQTVAADSGDVPVKQTNRLHIIIGAVAAVVVVLVIVAIAVVALVLHRRRRQTKPEHLQADASQVVPHSLVAGEALYENCPETPSRAGLPARQNGSNHPAADDARTTRVSDTSDYYSVIGTSDETSFHDDSTLPVVYAKVNKSRPNPSPPSIQISRKADSPKIQAHSAAPVYAKVNKSGRSKHTEVPLTVLNTNDSIYAVPDAEIDTSSTNKTRKCRNIALPAVSTNADVSIYEIPDDEADNSQNYRHTKPHPDLSNGSDSLYSVPDDEVGNSYADKSQNCGHAAPPPSSSNGDDSAYTIPDDEAEHHYVNRGFRHVQGFQDPVGAGSGGNDNDRMYYILEKEGTKDEKGIDAYQAQRDKTATPPGGQGEAEQQYNVLDFDTNRRRPFRQAGGDGWKTSASPAAADNVYNHLGEGDEGAYREMGTERRPVNVIDGEYSHIMYG